MIIPIVILAVDIQLIFSLVSSQCTLLGVKFNNGVCVFVCVLAWCVCAAGTGESGKSTFIKQMRIIHGGGYSETDRRKFIVLIHRNIYTAMGQLVEAMEDLEIAFQSAEAEDSAPEVTAIKPDTTQDITPGLKEKMAMLWRDEGIQSCYSRRREFQISDSAK